MSAKKIRVRFAPSPTGPLHIGGVRTALYNFLFAKKYQGKIILRIEDTDRNRYVEGAEHYMKNALEWLGITFDEGPEIGGDYAPYRQSERKDIYKKYVQQLLDTGHAYIAFDSVEELNAMRENLKKQEHLNPQYDSFIREHMKNSLTLSESEVKKKINQGTPHVIRLKVPKDEQLVINDLVRGTITVNTSQLDDKVLIKSDGMPTYHLAQVIDDHLMEISHVIRGEEWLPSAPFHALIYQCFGWKETMPSFAHLPLLLNPDGNGKLSKRNALAMGIPMFPMCWKDPQTKETFDGFKENGYLPEALVNFIAFLGWNPGDDRELFTISELIEAFTLDHVGKAGARFFFQKATWFNQHYLKEKSNDELITYLRTSLEDAQLSYDETKMLKVVEVLKDRVSFPNDFFAMGKFFFAPPSLRDQEGNNFFDLEDQKIRHALKVYTETIDTEVPLSPQESIAALDEIVEQEKISKGRLMQAVRWTLTGEKKGLNLVCILGILGRKETIERLQCAIETGKK